MPKTNFLYRLKHDQKNSEFIKNTETFIKRIQKDSPEDFYNALSSLTPKIQFNYQTVDERMISVRVLNRKWIVSLMEENPNNRNKEE